MRLAAFSTISLAEGRARFGANGGPTREIPCPDLGALKQALAEDASLIQGDLSDFRRAADNVRLAQLGGLLCASALGNAWSPEETALIGLNGNGCARNNRLYWNDFIAHGRETGRASLFVPTLPSIPVCEAAIALGIHGPVRYLKTATEPQTAELLEEMFASDAPLRQIMTVEVADDGANVRLLARE